MSHFTVLVPANDEAELYERLIPYYEYGTSTKKDDDLKSRGLLEFVSVEEEYREKYQDDGVDMVQMPDGRMLYTWDDEFRVPGTIGSGSGTHKVPGGLEIVNVPHKEKYATFEEFIEDWGGYELNEEHSQYGYFHNPNDKWDWFVIGGRASGILGAGLDDYDPTKDSRNYEKCALCNGTGYRTDVVLMLAGYSGPPFAKFDIHPLTGEECQPWGIKQALEYLNETGCNGCGGNGEKLKFNSRWAEYDGDSPLVDQINWNAIQENRVSAAEKRWQDYESTFNFTYRFLYRWMGLLFDTVWPICCKRKWWFVRDWFWKLMEKFSQESPGWNYSIDPGQSHASYIREAAGAPFYAFIDMEGNWNQRGKMGWFGMDDKSKGTDNYDEAFWNFVEGLPKNQRVYVVDCHI